MEYVAMRLVKSLREAAECYVSRQERKSHPSGDFDKAKRWYPDTGERCACCDSIREPSRAWPWSLMVHCRTLSHVAQLYGVGDADLRKAVRSIRPPTKPDRHPIRYKSVAKVDGRYYSIYDGSEYTMGQERYQPCRPDHGGGYYVYASPEEAAHAAVPETSKLYDKPRVILKVQCGGRCLRYGRRKMAYSRVTPLAEVKAPEEREY